MRHIWLAGLACARWSGESPARQEACSILLRPVLVAAVVTAALLIAPAADGTPGSIQVSGKQLESAFPAASYFGHGTKILSPFSSGGGLQHYPATGNPAKANCAATGFPSYYADPGYGQTAVTFEGVQKALTSYNPNISQFANARTASAVFNAERAKTASCRSYNEPPVGGSTEHVTQSVSETHIGGHLTFVVKQEISFSDIPGSTLPSYVFVTVDGSDVFSDLILGTSAPQPSGAAVTLYMIGKVSALR